MWKHPIHFYPIDLICYQVFVYYFQSADHLTYAYKFGSFLKIQEFVELRERLENSIHFAMTTVDKMLLEMSWCDSPTAVTNSLSSMHIQPAVDSIQWDLLRDNRDVDVRSLYIT